MATPVILDTDIGMDVDDAFALVLAARHPMVDLRAVTTVNGDTAGRADLARAMLRLAGRTDVPVGAGASDPVDGTPTGFMPVDHVDRDPVVGAEPGDHPSADEVLAAALESAEEPVTICMIGATTNVATFLHARPDLLDRVAGLRVMGGCLGPYSSDGVEGPPYEFNVGCDPISTAALLALPLPISLVTIDVTVHTHLTDDDRAAVRAAGPLGRALDVLSDNFLALLAGFMPEASPKVRLHDPITVAALIEPSIATFETRLLSAHGPAGECRTVETPHGRPVECLTAVDGERLAALLVETVTSP